MNHIRRFSYSFVVILLFWNTFLISSTTLANNIPLKSASAGDCHIIKVSHTTTTSITFACNSKVNLTKHPIVITFPKNSSGDHFWSSDIPAQLHTTINNNKVRIITNNSWKGDGNDVILDKGTSATLKFNYNNPSSEWSKQHFKDNTQLYVSSQTTKGSIVFNEMTTSSAIPDQATVDLLPTSSKNNTAYHFKWKQLQNDTQSITVGTYQISIQYNNRHIQAKPATITVKHNHTAHINLMYHPYPNQITFHLNRNHPAGTHNAIKARIIDETDGSSSLISIPWHGQATIKNLQNNHQYSFSTDNPTWGKNQRFNIQFSPNSLTPTSQTNRYSVQLNAQGHELNTYPLTLKVKGLPKDISSQIMLASHGKLMDQKITPIQPRSATVYL